MEKQPGPVGISPRVDCVFKAILGDPKHKALLLDFLNAVLAPEAPIVDVEFLNPELLPDTIGDAYIVIDVKAKDSTGRLFQVEMQTSNETALKERMLFSWADIFVKQLPSGARYSELMPVVSIWLLDQNTLRSAPSFHHRFTVSDLERQVTLTDRLELHLIELDKWRKSVATPPVPPPRGQKAAAGLVATEKAAQALRSWVRFFAEGESWSQVPPELKGGQLEEAMGVLEQFKQSGELNELYRKRIEAQARRATEEAAREKALKDLAIEQKARRAAEEARDAAEARESRLRELLRNAGIDPDAK